MINRSQTEEETTKRFPCEKREEDLPWEDLRSQNKDQPTEVIRRQILVEYRENLLAVKKK